MQNFMNVNEIKVRYVWEAAKIVPTTKALTPRD